MRGVLRFPADEILIFGTSLLIVVPFVLAVTAAHATTPGRNRFWTQAACSFATIYAVFALANYVVQLSSVIPARLRGESARVEHLIQSPHSLLWDFDAIAYIAMGTALLLLAPAMDTSRSSRRFRIAAGANAVATILAGIVYFTPDFSNSILLLGLPWAITTPAVLLLLGDVLRRSSRRYTASDWP
jgi:uncharacterized membrane protein